MKLIHKKYDFDDVLIEPVPSCVNSRDDVDISIDLGKFRLGLPIVASPMKGIVGLQLVEDLSLLGGIGILHRFYEKSEYGIPPRQLADFHHCYNKGILWGMAVSLNDPYETYMRALDFGTNIICIDVANGYTLDVLNYCETIAIELEGYNCLLMAGNVATWKGAFNLYQSGVNLVRVGIGSGTLCTTRNVTGVGVPQISAIIECTDARSNYATKMYDPAINSREFLYTVADGGIRNSGDAVKAIAAGADLVMLGTLFAKTFESENNGIIYGMASRKLQEEYYHGVKSVEGLEKEIKRQMTMYDFINEFAYGIKSACTYVNARNLHELYGNANFVESGTGSIKKL